MKEDDNIPIGKMKQISDFLPKPAELQKENKILKRREEIYQNYKEAKRLVKLGKLKSSSNLKELIKILEDNF